ncbi:ABC transporter substrate-binding protein [Aquipuribacter nitratireducens]|uniref:ABC transporter substrate-binding protein n=1 Tax=Aquipuribacter nitratireducens TaxID=650104 RepID=A0ABW0GP52_9MICO
MTRNRTLFAAAALGLSATLVAACGGDDATTAGGGASEAAGGSSGEDVTLTWWHNGNNDPALGYWQGIADEYEAQNPNVSIEISALQNEDLRTRLTAALQSNDPPDLFQQWGGGEMQQQVESGLLMDLTDEIPDAIEPVGGSAAGWTVDDRVYGLPFSLGVVGVWYNQALFEEAGISETPETLEEFLSVTAQLKDAGITPVAVGAADKWPAAHWWYYAAVRECDQDTLEEAGQTFDFSDPCFVRAGEVVQEIVEAEPFNEGYLGTSAQQGATSSAGLLATGEVAMELMGHWNPSVMEGLTEDGTGLGEDLGWFPFPTTDGEGDPTAALGGGDGFSCSAQAPPECADFLAFVMSPENQEGFGGTGIGIPTVAGTQEAVADENLAVLADYRDEAPYVQLYLDTAYGPNVGGALNDAVALLFAGEATPEDVVEAVEAAAATQ